jgi:hypothetical protein
VPRRLTRSLSAIGIIGAAVSATPCSRFFTPDSLWESVGQKGALNDRFQDAPFVYGILLRWRAGHGVVLMPGMPLIGVVPFDPGIERRSAAASSDART